MFYVVAGMCGCANSSVQVAHDGLSGPELIVQVVCNLPVLKTCLKQPDALVKRHDADRRLTDLPLMGSTKSDIP